MSLADLYGAWRTHIALQFDRGGKGEDNAIKVKMASLNKLLGEMVIEHQSKGLVFPPGMA